MRNTRQSRPTQWPTALFLRLTSFERREITTLVLLAAVSAGIWAFVSLGSEVLEGDTEGIDRMILLAMRSPADLRDPLGPPWVEEFARDVTALGGVAILTFVTLAVGGFLYLEGKARTSAFLLLAVFTGLLASTALKTVYRRPRPDLVPHGSYVYTASFPSGHSLMSAVTYLSLGAMLARSHQRKRIKAYVLSVSVLVTVAVGGSRVYLGVHWPTDVLAGWTAGSVWAIVCWIAAKLLQEGRQIERAHEQAPET